MSKPSESPWPIELSPSFRVLRPLIIALGTVMLFLLGPVRVRGKSNIPRSGGVLLLLNHISDVDPVVTQYACRRHVYFISKSELFEMPSIAWFLRMWRSFPIRRNEPDRTALKHAIRLLELGHVVCLYPEGQLSENGELLEILPGAALIARSAGVPVVCGGIVGTSKIIPYGTVVPRPAFGNVGVNWGDPRAISKADDATEFTSWVRSELLRLTGR